MQSVKNNRCTLVEQWCHCVNSETTTEGVVEGSEGDDKSQSDEDEE